MVTIFIRTVFIYLFLILSMRLMGKRQIGELDISELITTLLLSETASLPLTDTSIPLSHSVVPIITLVSFEVISSYVLVRFPKLKNVVSTRPTVLIDKGSIDRASMIKARISVDELMSELRQQGIWSISEVQYAILEQNGKITVIQKAQYKTPNAEQLGLSPKETGISHIVICEGTLNKNGISSVNETEETILKKARKKGAKLKEVYLMTVDDSGKYEVIKKEKKSGEKKS